MVLLRVYVYLSVCVRILGRTEARCVRACVDASRGATFRQGQPEGRARAFGEQSTKAEEGSGRSEGARASDTRLRTLYEILSHDAHLSPFHVSMENA